LIYRCEDVGLVVVCECSEGTAASGNLAVAAEQSRLTDAALAEDVEDIDALVERCGEVAPKQRDLIVAADEFALLALADAVLQAGAAIAHEQRLHWAATQATHVL